MPASSVVRGATSSNGTSGSVTLTSPGGITTGDKCTVCIARDSGTSSFNAPSGWTLIGEGNFSFGEGDYYFYRAIYGTDITGTSWTWSSGGSPRVSGSMLVLNSNAGAFRDYSYASRNGQSISSYTASYTVSGTPAYLIGLQITTQSTGNAVTWPSGWVEETDTGTTHAGSSTGAFDTAPATPGTYSVNIHNSDSGSFEFALLLLAAYDVAAKSGASQVSGSGLAVFGATPGLTGTMAATGSGTAVFAKLVNVPGTMSVSGSGTSAFLGLRNFPGSGAFSGSGTARFQMTQASSKISVWTGTQWANVPSWVWDGTKWKIAALTVYTTNSATRHGLDLGAAAGAALDAFEAANGLNVDVSVDAASSASWAAAVPSGADGYTTAIAAASPVAWYRLDGDYTDKTGGLPATRTAGTASFGDSLAGSGRSLALDGTGYVTAPDQAKLHLSGAVSLELWCQASFTGTTDFAIIAGNRNWLLERYANHFAMFVSTNTDQIGSTTPIVLGQTYHVVAVWNNGVGTLYVNGNVELTYNYSSFPSFDASGFLIGTWTGNTAQAWKGSIDEVAVYSRALPQSEVQAHYTAGTAATAALSTFKQWSDWLGERAGRRLVYSVPLLTSGDDPGLSVPDKLVKLASGDYDAHFTAIGRIFNTFSNLNRTRVRLGPDFNSSGLPWSVPPGDQQSVDMYKIGYARAAARIRNACPSIMFEWAPAMGLNNTQRTLADLYPGDGFVDFIGLTVSDSYPTLGTDSTTRFNLIQTQTNGLADQMALCTAHGKRPVLTDWSLSPSRMNLVPNPTAHTDLTNFFINTDTATAAAPTMTQLTGLTDPNLPANVTTGVDVTQTAGTRSWSLLQNFLNTPTLLRAGNVYTLSFYARSLSGPGSLTVAVGDGDGTHLVKGFSSAPGLTSSWQRYSFSFTAAINSLATSSIYLAWNTNSALELQFAGFQIETGAAATSYFDGDTPSTGTNTYAWLGMAHASSSIDYVVGVNGGGDDPNFIAAVINWMIANQYAYSIYNDVTATIEPSALLSDDFSTKDLVKWTWGAAAATSGGQLVLTPNNSYTGSIISASSYNFTGSAVTVELVQRANVGAGATESYLQLASSPTSNVNNLIFDVKETHLYAFRDVSGVRTTVASATYDPVAHRWLRIYEAAGTVYWDTSPDGVNWANFTTWISSFSVAGMSVVLGSGYSGVESSPGTVIFDNFKFSTAPVGPRLLQSDNFSTKNTTKWTWGSGASVVSGQLNLHCDNGYSGSLNSNSSYSFLNSAAVLQAIQMPEIGTGTTGSGFNLMLDVNDGAHNFIQTTVGGGVLQFRIADGSGAVITYCSITYDPVAHAYWRIRETGGSVYLETSPDGATWTQRATALDSAISFSLQNLYPAFWCGYWGTESSPRNAIYDNFNFYAGHTDGLDSYPQAKSQYIYEWTHAGPRVTSTTLTTSTYLTTRG